MTHIEKIAYHKQQLAKALESHGAESEHFVCAFYQLQGAKMGMPESKLFKWALAETERLSQISLDQL